jgi:putative membrane protein
VITLIAAMLAALLGATATMLPGLHVLNLLTMLSLLWNPTVPADIAIVIVGANLGAYTVTSALPTCLLASPDESSFFSVLPAQQLLAQGRAGQALGLCALGSRIGVLVVAFLLLPPLQQALAGIHQLLRPHLYWLLWAVTIYLLQSEWPRPQRAGQSSRQELQQAWRQIGAGLLVFFTAGLLGCIVLGASPLPSEHAAQGLMPVFVGLFALPWLITSSLTARTIPPQSLALRTHIPATGVARGAAAGIVGGTLATAIPGVTGGVGGWMAGQLLGTHEPRIWLIAQSTTRTIYYLASCALLLLPGIAAPRGGAAWMLYTRLPQHPGPPHQLPLFIGACLLGITTAHLLLKPLARLLLLCISIVTPRYISLYCMLLLIAFTAALTGWPGLLLLLTATGIGLLPQSLGCKRMHLLAVILVPIAMNMSGAAPHLARLLRFP